MNTRKQRRKSINQSIIRSIKNQIDLLAMRLRPINTLTEFRPIDRGRGDEKKAKNCENAHFEDDGEDRVRERAGQKTELYHNH